ncbi:hypothetical protein HY345_02375 [Candidatus Microgenomates bacterium]|nr:hypothetical protein [Candidatus Microgenomates bacterium]
MPKKAAKNGPKDEVIIEGYKEYKDGGGEAGTGGFAKRFSKLFGATKLHVRNVLEKDKRRKEERARREQLGGGGPESLG